MHRLACRWRRCPACPPRCARPDYDIGAVGVGIVHLGLGAFHRAHQAVYTDAILHRHPGWGICGVSLKTPRAIAALAPQDGLYSVLERGTAGISLRVVGAVRELLFLGNERAACSRASPIRASASCR